MAEKKPRKHIPPSEPVKKPRKHIHTEEVLLKKYNQSEKIVKASKETSPRLWHTFKASVKMGPKNSPCGGKEIEVKTYTRCPRGSKK